MSRDPRHDVLFSPIRVGPKTMRNRFYATPHCNGFGTDSPGAQAEFRATRAEGGWAVVNTEYCSIHPSSDDAPTTGSRLWDKTDVRNLAVTCDKIHEHGALAGVELWYGSMHALNFESRLAPRGVSQVPSDYLPLQTCTTMDKTEIVELQRFYVDAAKRACEAGFDIINIYGGHTHPITALFLEPYYNKREDEYGGSFENRARFYRETLDKVREAVGSQCAIAARFGIDTLRAGESGIKADGDGRRFVTHVDDLVDLWDFVIGNLEWSDAGPSRVYPENYQHKWIEQMRPFTTKPIVCVGRFTNPDTMVQAVKSGQADIIGAARPGIADPFLPRKIEQGRLNDIRECIGCNVCLSRWVMGGRIICTQNATAGEEYRRGWHPEKFTRARNADRDVLVVGAGPAGMECARILGERGLRRVHLVDAASEVGGAMQWIPQLPGLGEWARVVTYRQTQLRKLRNVEVIRKTTLDVHGVLEYGADIVVFATGSHWVGNGMNAFTHEPVPGADSSLPHVFTPEQLMVEKNEIRGSSVVVYDCEGYFMGVSLAEKLAGDGNAVTIVTPSSKVAWFTENTMELPHIRRMLNRLNVTIVREHTVSAVAPGEVTVTDVYAPERSRTVQADSIVLVTQRASADRLYREVRANPQELEQNDIVGVYRVGDCVAPRILAEAIFDGHRLAREIDSSDPATALPFIRENRILGSADHEYDGQLKSAEQ